LVREVQFLQPLNLRLGGMCLWVQFGSHKFSHLKLRLELEEDSETFVFNFVL